MVQSKRERVVAAEDQAFAGDHAGAAATMRQACDEDPADADLWFLLGWYLAGADDLHGAGRALAEALAIDPDHGQTHHALANCLRDLGRLEPAASHYRKALEALEDEPDAVADFGLCYLRSGDDDLAAAMFRRALTLDPTCALALKGLAAVGEPAGAETVFETRAGAENDSETGAENDSETGAGAGAENGSETRDADIGFEVGPASGSAAPLAPPPGALQRDRRLGGPAARSAGARSNGGATAIGDEVSPADPDDPPPLLAPTSLTPLLYDPEVDWEGVASEAEAAIAADPEDWEAALRLGGACVRLREFEHAAAVLERLLARTDGRGGQSSVHAEALSLMAEMLVERRDSLAAYRVGQTLGRLYPGQPRTLFVGARVSHLCGDARAAIRSLKELVRMDPDGPMGRMASLTIAQFGG